jgi:hypothetical protein
MMEIEVQTSKKSTKNRLKTGTFHGELVEL